MAQRSRLPDGLVEGSTEQLAAVLTEAHTRHTFTVGALEPPQALPTLDLPHLYTHTSNAASECYQFRNKDGIPGSEVTGHKLAKLQREGNAGCSRTEFPPLFKK